MHTELSTPSPVPMAYPITIPLHFLGSIYTPGNKQSISKWIKWFKNLFFTCPQQNLGSREGDPSKILLRELILALHGCTETGCCRNPLPRGSLRLSLQPCSHLTCQTSPPPAEKFQEIHNELKVQRKGQQHPALFNCHTSREFLEGNSNRRAPRSPGRDLPGWPTAPHLLPAICKETGMSY